VRSKGLDGENIFAEKTIGCAACYREVDNPVEVGPAGLLTCQQGGKEKEANDEKY